MLGNVQDGSGKKRYEEENNGYIFFGKLCLLITFGWMHWWERIYTRKRPALISFNITNKMRISFPVRFLIVSFILPSARKSLIPFYKYKDILCTFLRLSLQRREANKPTYNQILMMMMLYLLLINSSEALQAWDRHTFSNQ